MWIKASELKRYDEFVLGGERFRYLGRYYLTEEVVVVKISSGLREIFSDHVEVLLIDDLYDLGKLVEECNVDKG